MSKSKKPKKSPAAKPSTPEPGGTGLRSRYNKACQLAESGAVEEAARLYEDIVEEARDPAFLALLQNDLAVLAAMRGDLEVARQGLAQALTLHTNCEIAQSNAAFLHAAETETQPGVCSVALPCADSVPMVSTSTPEPKAIKLAILSFLFNWPSTGGGNIHTAELAYFLSKANYDVQHFYVRYAPWGIGNVGETPFPAQALEFSEPQWNLHEIQRRVRHAIDAFSPDFVLITDSWNIKPILAEAVAGYRYILRLQAMECLCPLNNVRLLPGPDGSARQCGRHQLATPEDCLSCLRQNGHTSGGLHRAERALSEVEQPGYYQRLRRCLREATAVLVVNPLSEAMISPYTDVVRVAPSGMNPDRFRWPRETSAPTAKLILLFAGLIEEWMKGFHILQAACALLWQKRQDFELLATGDPPGQMNSFTRLIGWQSQDALAEQLSKADVLMMPTIAQEALGRTAVEAMAAGIPVIASRLGGLPTTVADGATGLLFEPGDVADLAAKIERLLDDPELRKRLGQAGRRRFEEHYSWDVIIARHYKPLLVPRRTGRHQAFQPIIRDHVDPGQLIVQVSRFFALPQTEVEHKFRLYQQVHEAKGYARTLGEFKTVCFEEAFVLFVLLSVLRPGVVVEIGAAEGKTTRRLLDMLSLLGLDCRVICFDRQAQAGSNRYVAAQEATLVTREITGRFSVEVIEAYKPTLVFLDVHTHALLHEAIRESMATPGLALALHDCSRGLCNPQMTIASDDLRVSSTTGVWERHVLAELFGVSDPLSVQLDQAQTKTHRMQIFDTPHGLGVILPRRQSQGEART